MTDYDKPGELYAGLRLHQNENTGGCSPRVLEALRSITAEQMAVYPPYQATVEACARHFGVDPSEAAPGQRARRRHSRGRHHPSPASRPTACFAKR